MYAIRSYYDQGRLVNQIFQVSAGKTGRSPGNDRHVDVIGQFGLLTVDFKDLFPSSYNFV